MANPTEMGVNVIEQGIVNMPRVIEACGAEILRRHTRYVLEYAAGDEWIDTVQRARQILEEYVREYPGILPTEILPHS